MKELSDLIGINYYTYHGYESGKSKMPLDFGILLLRHPRFRKYRDWFMFDEMNPKVGQVVPALAHIGPDDSELSHYGNKTGE